MAGLVAVAPAGSEREEEPPATFQGSLPDTTFAPPDSVQACVAGSNEPPGTVVYEALSPNPANGVLSAFASQLRAVDTSSPAFAVGATIATAVATAARARVLTRRAVTCLIPFEDRPGAVPCCHEPVSALEVGRSRANWTIVVSAGWPPPVWGQPQRNRATRRVARFAVCAWLPNPDGQPDPWSVSGWVRGRRSRRRPGPSRRSR